MFATLVEGIAVVTAVYVAVTSARRYADTVRATGESYSAAVKALTSDDSPVNTVTYPYTGQGKVRPC